MSFLLDALGKADNDRRQAIVPELQTYYDEPSTLRRTISRLLLLVLLLLFFILGYASRPFIEQRLASSQVETELAIERDVESPAVPEVVAEPAPEPEVMVESVPVTEPVSETVQAVQPEDVEPIKDELVAKRLRVDAISFSPSPSTRFAMINGVVVHEGDVLGSGERLLKIERNSVVIELEGNAYRIGM